MIIDQDVKQVLVLRHDLKMRYGKGAAQASHASNYFLLDRLEGISFWKRLRFLFGGFNALLNAEERRWFAGGTKKICVRVESQSELEEIIAEAQAFHLPVYPVMDAGLTEFGGVPTLTGCSIGPALSTRIDLVTKGLKLL